MKISALVLSVPMTPSRNVATPVIVIGCSSEIGTPLAELLKVTFEKVVGIVPPMIWFDGPLKANAVVPRFIAALLFLVQLPFTSIV